MKYSLLLILICFGYGQERIYLKGGNPNSSAIVPIGMKTPGTYEFLRYRKENGEYKWAGLFYSSIISEIKENEQALKYGNTARIFGVLQPVFLVGGPALLFSGIQIQNSQPEDEDGKKELSPVAIGMVGGAFACVFGYGASVMLGKHYIKKSVAEWNKAVVSLNYQHDKYGVNINMPICFFKKML